MLDAGTGMFRAGEHLKTPELDIFLPPAHLDHVVGLTYLFSVAQAHPLRRVTAHGTVETLAAIDAHLFFPALFPTRPPLELRPLAPCIELSDGGRLTHFPLEHRGGSTGFRLDWPGRSMAYVTDTAADPEAPYVEKLRGIDLLIHECYFSDAQAGRARKLGHSHTTQVAEVARRADVERLVLVHADPTAPQSDPIGLEAARAIFPQTLLGEDLMELEF